MLLSIALLAHLSTEWIGFSLLTPNTDALPAAVCSTIILVLITYFLLAAYHKQARLMQTLTAMAGAITVINLVGIPLSMWWQTTQNHTENNLIQFLLLAVAIWSVAIQGHIFRHALTISFALGILISICFFLFTFQVINYLLPVDIS